MCFVGTEEWIRPRRAYGIFEQMHLARPLEQSWMLAGQWEMPRLHKIRPQAQAEAPVFSGDWDGKRADIPPKKQSSEK